MQKLIATLVLVSFVGCAHNVTITSYPAANVRIDGQDFGETPATFVDRHSTGHEYSVRLSKPGYDPRAVVLQQQGDGGCIALSIIAGVLLIVPLVGLLFCAKLPQASYDYDLRVAADRSPAAIPAPAPQVQPVPSL